MPHSPLPRWRILTGFFKSEEHLGPKQRNIYLTKLNRIVTNLLREFINGEYRTLPKDMRAPTWTPLPYVCQELEIAYAHLSRLLRELTGLNPLQTYDKLKLTETQVPLKYIALIQAFLKSDAATSCQRETRNQKLETQYSGNGSRHFWKWLKAQRMNPDFDRQALAREFDFPSASRFHRAFYFATDLTPREFENTIIRQSIDAPADLEKTIARFTPPKPYVRPESSPNRRLLPREPQCYHPLLVNEIGRITAYMRSRGHYEDYSPVFDLPRSRYQPQRYPMVLYKKPKPNKPEPEPIIDVEFTILSESQQEPRTPVRGSQSATRAAHASKRQPVIDVEFTLLPWRSDTCSSRRDQSP